MNKIESCEKKKLYRTALISKVSPPYGYYVGECVSVEYRGETATCGSMFKIEKSGGRLGLLVLENSLEHFVL